MNDKLEIDIIRRLQEDIPIVAEPYREIAHDLGIDEDELLKILAQYKANGVLKRVGAILRHRKVGYNANAMVVWEIPEDEVDGAAQMMASYPMISHCYERTTTPHWKYNLYTMIHCESKDECSDIVEEIIERIGEYNYSILYSTEELKKTSVKYFIE